MRDFEILRGLEELEVERRSQPDVQQLVSGNVGLVEAILSPHTTLDGKTLKLSDFKGSNLVLYFFPKADTPG